MGLDPHHRRQDTRAARPNPYASIPKDQLLEMKAQYLVDLAKPTITPSVRSAIQQELSVVNAAIKEQNIAQARRDKSEADRRKAMGQKTFAENTARAVASVAMPPPPVAPAPVPAPMAIKRNGGWPKGIGSLGELILMRAEQLKTAIKRIKSARESYTDEFLIHVEAFVVAQRELVAKERAVRKDVAAGVRAAVVGGPIWLETPADPITQRPKKAETEDWKETWNEEPGNVR